MYWQTDIMDFLLLLLKLLEELIMQSWWKENDAVSKDATMYTIYILPDSYTTQTILFCGGW